MRASKKYSSVLSLSDDDDDDEFMFLNAPSSIILVAAVSDISTSFWAFIFYAEYLILLNR